MSLRCIVVEIRKNLHCANVFMQFDQSLTETEFLKIHVDSNDIRLKEYSTETSASVAGHFAIEAPTLSNLIVEECNASFRVRIKPMAIDGTGANDSQLADPKPQITVGQKIELECKNCRSKLCADGEQTFQRILEFPSGSIDIGEFFCHHGPDYGPLLVPRSNDLFYGFHFIVLNTELVNEKTKEKEGHIYCKRCLRYLGETLFARKASKLWTDSVRASLIDTAELIDIFAKQSLSATSQLMMKIKRETTIGPEIIHQMEFSKVLLEATFPNRMIKYLMLNILEKNLDILRNPKPLAHGSLNNNVLHVKLEKCKSFKILYKFVDEQENESALLSFWKSDISIHSMRISPQLFSSLIEELEENVLLIPEIYRHNGNGFILSYVFY